MARDPIQEATRYLACHRAEFLRGEFAADDVLTQGGIRLVLEVDKQGADLALVCMGRVTKLRKHRLFDCLGTMGDEIAG